MIRVTVPLAITFFLVGCGENPTALDDLDPEVEFAIEAARVETFIETPIHVRAMESGVPMMIQETYLEIRHTDEEDVRRVLLERNDGGYQAHAYFFEEGDYQVRMMGRLNGHAIVAEFGEREVRVERQRQLIGPYWVEIEIPGGPVLENSTRDLHLLVYDLLADGSRGNPASGLTISASVQAPDEDEHALLVEDEGSGEYAMTYAFDHGGQYALRVSVEVGGGEFEGEFRVPVHEPGFVDDGTSDEEEGGGNGH